MGNHSRKHRGIIRRIRHRLRRARWLWPAVILIAVAALGTGYFVHRMLKSQRMLEVMSRNQADVDLGYRVITWNGKKYRYNNLIRTILYAGIDSDGVLEPYQKYAMAGRADSIQLVVLDEKHGAMSVIGISRDTMTPIRRYGIDGTDEGLAQDHLGYAYTYGENGKISCNNLCEAVSTLLCGIPVNEYIVTNRSSLEGIMDILGAVPVTVPNDSLAGEYPEFRKGAVVEITSGNAETFLRTRDTGEDFTNIPRMERQQSFINAAEARIRTLVEQDPHGLWKRLPEVEGYMQTSITRSDYLDLVDSLRKTQYSEQNYYQLPGENVVGEYHDEFYPDIRGIRELVMNMFYQ